MRDVFSQPTGTGLRRALATATLLLATGAQLAGAAEADTEVKAQLYTHLNLIDGSGAPLQRDRAMLVEDGRISAIVSSAEATALVDEGVEVIDGAGGYALPGLIDTHVHLATSPEDEEPLVLLRRQLYGGVTSVRDMAGDVRVLALLARDTRLDRIAGPDVYYVALMAGESFFQDPRPASAARGEVPGAVPWMQAITADTDMPLAVARAKGTWATAIKIYANLPAAEVSRITAEAHRQGMLVWAHSSVFPASPGEVVAAGVDVISHVCRLAFETTDGVPEIYHHGAEPDYASIDPADRRITAVFDDMAARGTILDATIGLYGKAEALFNADQDNARKSYPGCPLSFAGRLVQVAREHGVDVATGTDFVNAREHPWPALYGELDALVEEAGMSPLQVIHSATAVGARALGIDSDTGTLEVGKRADFLLLREDPSVNLKALQSLQLTVKHGVPYPREDYQPDAAPTGAGLDNH
ncbi:amidohydrolase family protein [Parahaliea aestuarii]|uniref:Amidohydrolase family protein n=1 Tax=Parahaliea aestuarii TaxID=1852021 RepID=A0A5C9A301_9GAMM|nr:amidohydrolase family protein [Parahaliea aestuarii]TXS94384.1 amidohydrolase family protein [Parahaliea aestuarii]